mmetsp:Transcript_118482/g.335911  ORF Transcript_118482/g.335911 Transcript_118482/m.335911 type:complete len:210 (-) Transcript_118482:34-663(-)
MTADATGVSGGASVGNMNGRLAQALSTNHVLHAKLAEKRRLLEESQAEIGLLRTRIARRAVEVQQRTGSIEALQSSLQGAGVAALGEAAESGAAPAAVSIAREVARLEAKIEALNAENLQLADKHQGVRSRLVEERSRLRTLWKHEHELAKNLDSLAGSLTQASRAACMDEAGDATRGAPVDYRNLPGLCVLKLVGGLLQPPMAAQAPE